MSPENAEERMRWGYAWFNREKDPPPTWLPDGEFVNAREDPDHTTYRGIDAIRSNGDRVFVWVRFSGHGADSGAAMEMELAHGFTLEGEKTRRLEEYFDRDEALAAVGLRE
jgi:ketosteroid isomerase-like protein